MNSLANKIYSKNENVVFNISKNKTHLLMIDITSDESTFFKLEGVAGLIFLTIDGEKKVSSILQYVHERLNQQMPMEEIEEKTPQLINDLLKHNVISEVSS